MKTCCTCLESHPVEFFNKDRTQKDGRYPRCKTCSRAASKRSFVKHNVAHRKLKQRWKDDNRARHREINAAWRAANPQKVREGTASYRARLKRATPPWVAKNMLDIARDMCPAGYHVDHIHPLAGENFCGLNVPWNLQFLPAEEHFKKGTKLLTSSGG